MIEKARKKRASLVDLEEDRLSSTNLHPNLKAHKRKRRPEVNRRDRAGVQYGLAPPDIYWFPLRPPFKDVCPAIFSVDII